MADIESDRRRQILEAALGCFLARGYAATSIADIRKASGASTGSIYHFFAGKTDLARALLDDAVAGWSAAAGPPRETDPAETAIKRATAGLVRWGTGNLALLRFMDELRTRSDATPAFAPLREAFAAGRALGRQQYRRYAERGEVRPLPWPVAHALMLGPAYDYLRLVGAGHPPSRRASHVLADAAWQAVRARDP